MPNRNYEKLEEMKNKYNEVQMSEEQVKRMKDRIQDAKMQKRRNRRSRIIKGMSAAAAAVAIFILLPNTSQSVAHAMSNIPLIGGLVEVVTFRDYQYEDERNKADITVPEIVAEKEPRAESTPEGQQETGAASVDSKVQEEMSKTAEEINAEIQQITEQYVQEFEENLKAQEGYQNMTVDYEVLNSTEDYFTLKLICFQSAGSGMEWNYFYTIDLNTGERLELKDLFVEGADYITPISENIKTQMKEQMETDDSIMYWLDYEDVPEGVEDWNFESITDETSFYVNENGNIVISFNEGDVAPMYMGTPEFEIPTETVSEIRK